MAETKRVLILAVRFGSGHWQAALALKKALIEAHPAIKVDVVNYIKFSGFWFDIILRLVYHDLMIRVPPLYRRFFYYTDRLPQDSLFQKFIKTCGAPAFLQYLRRKKPDLIISTYPVPAAALSWLKQRGLVNCPLVTVITDYILHRMWIQPGTDLYIVPSRAVAEDMVRQGVPPEQVAETGIPIDLRFKRTGDTPPLEVWGHTPFVGMSPCTGTHILRPMGMSSMECLRWSVPDLETGEPSPCLPRCRICRRSCGHCPWSW